MPLPPTANLYLTDYFTYSAFVDGSILFSGNELIEQRSLIIQKLKPSGEQDTSLAKCKSIVRYNGKYNTIVDVQFLEVESMSSGISINLSFWRN